jgi:osmotically inducible protein OsmC
MPTRQAEATWTGDLKTGNGNFSGKSGQLKGPYNFGTRFENAPGTNPEELIAAAHAACFSMALSAGLGKAGHAPKRVHTTADVTIDKIGEGFKITKIVLKSEGDVPGIDEKTFKDFAEKTKSGCPVSQALSATPIELQVSGFKA